MSKRTGVTLSDAVIGALKAKLKVNRTKVDTLCAAIQDLPVIDGSTPEQILGSDDSAFHGKRDGPPGTDEFRRLRSICAGQPAGRAGIGSRT